MKVWARYAVPVMVLVDEDEQEIERVVMVPDERFIDRETMGDILFYTEQLERISSSQQQAAHALYVADHERWPDPAEWEIEDSWDMLSMSVDEQLHPSCPDCDGEGYTRGPRTLAARTTATRARGARPTGSSTATSDATPTHPSLTRTNASAPG